MLTATLTTTSDIYTTDTPTAGLQRRLTRSFRWQLSTRNGYCHHDPDHHLVPSDSDSDNDVCATSHHYYPNPSLHRDALQW